MGKSFRLRRKEPSFFKSALKRSNFAASARENRPIFLAILAGSRGKRSEFPSRAGEKSNGSRGRISKPCFLRLRSAIKSLENDAARCAQLEYLKPGKISSVAAMPPISWRRSKTKTFLRALAK